MCTRLGQGLCSGGERQWRCHRNPFQHLLSQAALSGLPAPQGTVVRETVEIL
jgi:hypothetical protein